MEIVKTPNPIFLQKSQPVKKIGQEILNVIEEMKETLLTTDHPKGVGLAASQVGKSLRIFLVKPWEKSPMAVFINPQIMEMAKEKTNGVPQRDNKYEGCLSIPHIWGLVKRAKRVKLKYQLITHNHELITRTRTFSGFMATIIQHEMDHLDGILFTQRVLEQKGKLFKITGQDKEGNDIFEEIEI